MNKVNKAVWWPAVSAIVLQLIFGLLGAFAFQLVIRQPDGSTVPRPNMDNILNRPPPGTNPSPSRLDHDLCTRACTLLHLHCHEGLSSRATRAHTVRE